jgi:hypothetical protein
MFQNVSSVSFAHAWLWSHALRSPAIKYFLPHGSFDWSMFSHCDSCHGQAAEETLGRTQTGQEDSAEDRRPTSFHLLLFGFKFSIATLVLTLHVLCIHCGSFLCLLVPVWERFMGPWIHFCLNKSCKIEAYENLHSTGCEGKSLSSQHMGGRGSRIASSKPAKAV